MNPPKISASWHIYHQLHSFGHSQKINPRTLGREDALTTLLGRFGAIPTPLDPGAVQRQFDYLCVNRATKYRHRMRLDRRIAEVDAHNPVEKHTEAVATRELVSLIRREMSESDWSILWMLAEGFTYGEVADKFGMSVARLKSRVSRTRSRIRSSPTGRWVQEALAGS
jgi:DNA-directed RNA polymerase specialized sigma24 family protein